MMEYTLEAGKSAPPLAVTGLALLGVSLQDWVLVLTAVYTLIQLFLAWPKIRARVRQIFKKE